MAENLGDRQEDRQPSEGDDIDHVPTREPITGDEPLGDQSRPPQALAEFYKAFASGHATAVDGMEVDRCGSARRLRDPRPSR
jgi:hypothetical protein